MVCVSPDLFDGESQAPEDQDHFQLHRLEAAVIVISVFIDHFRAEQADIIVIMQSPFVDPVHFCKFPGGKKIFLIFHTNLPLTVQSLYIL